MTLALTRSAATVFAPTTGGGAPRGAAMGEASTWGSEIETELDAAKTASSTATLGATYLKIANLPFTSLEMHGGSTGAAGSVNATAMLAALAAGKEVRLLRGSYAMEEVEYTLPDADADVAITGLGGQSSVLFFSGAELGIHIVQSAPATQMQGAKSSVRLAGFGCRTSLDDNTGVGVFIDYPDALSGSDSGTSASVQVDDLVFSGAGEDQYWGAGLRLNNVTYHQIRGVQGTGPEGSRAGTLIDLIGNKNNVDNSIEKPRGRNLSRLISVAGRYEGLVVDTPIGVDVDTGIYWHATLSGGETAQPWLDVRGGHINAHVAAIDTDRVAEGFVTGLNVYVASSGGKGLLVRNDAGLQDALYWQVAHNKFQTTVAKSAQQAIDFGDDCGFSVIDRNIIVNFHLGIGLVAGCNNCSGANLHRGNNTNVQNNGSGNTVT